MKHLVAFPTPIKRKQASVAESRARPHSPEFPSPIELCTSPDRGSNWWEDISLVLVRTEGVWYEAVWEEWEEVVRQMALGNAWRLQELQPHRQRVRLEWIDGYAPPANLRVVEPRPHCLYKVLDHFPSSEWKAAVDWRLELEETRIRNLRAPYLDDELRRAELRSEKYSPTDDAPGYIYLAQSRRTGALKLGFALDVRRRLQKLSAEYDDELFLQAWVPGTKRDERGLHRLLRAEMFPYRPGHGIEWYKDSQLVRAAIDNFTALRGTLPSEGSWHPLSDGSSRVSQARDESRRPKRRS